MFVSFLDVFLSLSFLYRDSFSVRYLSLFLLLIILFFMFFWSALFLVYFFFQAEDGIRDRSPSRGLGDVYKRQVLFTVYCLHYLSNKLFYKEVFAWSARLNVNISLVVWLIYKKLINCRKSKITL